MCDNGEWDNDFSIEPDILESKDDLGECNEENDGEMFRVPRDTIYDTYACEDGEWVSDFGGNSGEPVDPKTVVKGSFTDERDGKTYKTVKIGTQTWMAENLNYKTSGSRCYDKKNANCEKYGRLYTHAVAQNACPNGWKLPTGKQWAKLLNIDVSLFNLVGMFKYFSSHLGIRRYEINVEDAVEGVLKNLPKDLEISDQTRINISPRIRMTTLYAVAVISFVLL